MTNIEKIKRRIKKRKKVIDIENEARVINKKVNPLYKILMFTMSIYALFLSFAIYARKDENAALINKVFSTDINFTSFNKTMANILNLRIIENSNNGDDLVVSSSVSYIHLEGDYYQSDGNIVNALDDGVIIYSNEKDGSISIIVQYDFGVRVTYNNLKEVNVLVNDRVYKNDILGSYEDKVEIIFIKDKTKITYEEAISYM